MYDNATEKYKNIAKVLEDNGLDAYIYPQGSFSIGTVIRPYKEGEDKDYDLDFVCQINGSKEEFNPEEIKNLVGDILKEDGRYNTKLIEYDRCWTIEYADIADGVGFKIDIVPATSETQERVYSLISRGVEIKKAEKAIALTHKENNKFTWISSNPAAYTEWFEEKNRKAFQNYIYEQRSNIFHENRKIYNSVEDVPENKVKTPLQRSVQILKRHRDIYYDRSNANDYKPASTIITTLLAEVSNSSNDTADNIEFLDFAINEIRNMEDYFLVKNSKNLSQIFGKMISKIGNENWEMKNPVNPDDNLLDGWNNITAKMFFKWLKEVKEDLLDINLPLGLRNNKIASSLEINQRNALTSSIVRKIEPIKPWRC